MHNRAIVVGSMVGLGRCASSQRELPNGPDALERLRGMARLTAIEVQLSPVAPQTA